MFLHKIIHLLYKRGLKPILFRFDPEAVHDRVLKSAAWVSKLPGAKFFLSFVFEYRHPSLEQTILGIKFRNPVGLAAGFDKNGELTQLVRALGFGFEEIGSITGEPCEGNPKPRLWRLPKSRGIIVWYGLKNDGAPTISKRLKRLKFDLPVGISVAKTNSPKTATREKGIQDYLKAFKHFLDIGDYFTINISCPNAYGGEPFCSSLSLEALLSKLDRIKTPKPIFIKIPPDLSNHEVDRILAIAKKHRVHGFVVSNLTKDLSNLNVDPAEFKRVSQGKGGISGKPVRELSNKLISSLYKKAGDRFIIIGVGGIFSAEDAYKKIRLGASLVQLITGMIFEGPQLIAQINEGLVRLLKRDGFSTVSEAIGADVH